MRKVNRIKFLRDEKGWSQSKLAKKLEVKTAAVSKYENGEVGLTEKILRKLSEIFKCSIDYILCNDEPFDSEIFNGEELRLLSWYRKLDTTQQKALVALVYSFRLPKTRGTGNIMQNNGDNNFLAIGNGNKYVSSSM